MRRNQPTDSSSAAGEALWYLEGFIDSGRRTWRTLIRSLPLVVGRHPDCDLQLFSKEVSLRHAELFECEGELWIRDLGSTNGTAVNLEQLEGERALAEGDVLHLADLELRLSIYQPVDEGTTRGVDPGSYHRDSGFGCSASSVRRLLEEGSVRSLFQPVVELADRRILGYEALSRAMLDGVHLSPAELFSAAERLGLAGELSGLCRARALAAARHLGGAPLVFINLHPDEVRRPEPLLESLRQVRKADPNLRLVVEIHELTGSGIERMRRFQAALRELDIRLAFDDFGTGRARLLEMAEVPPDYLKFDISLIRDLDKAPVARRRVLASLVDLARSLGITPIAEGVERPAEAAACVEVGFQLAQGYLFGVPAQAIDFPEELTAQAQIYSQFQIG